jgi:hypothetical protein
MYLHYNVRSRQLRARLIRQLQTILDARMYSGFHASTASAPSLRAPAPEPYSMMAGGPTHDDPGNIKVVVRCRAFVPRGVLTSSQARVKYANAGQRRRRARAA